MGQNMKQQFKDQTKALADRYLNGQHAGRSPWFSTQFEALDNELRKPDPDLGLVASVLNMIEAALNRLDVPI